MLQLDLPEADDERGGSGASIAGQSVPHPPFILLPLVGLFVGPGKGRTAAEADPE